MKRGFTKSWRSELSCLLWSMPPMYHRVFYWLRQKAKWQLELVPTDRGPGIWLDPGMLITSYQIIAEGVAYSEMGLLRVPSKKTVGKVLQWLKTNELIELITSRFGTTIKIANWDKYQSARYETLPAKTNADSSKRKRRKTDPYAHLYIEEVNTHEEVPHAGG
ncbi:MAG: hypothetical protein HQK97_11405 [Nitrospirae bacterium]|nr:hypothetical protein [Nitrospirota bacterium]